MAAAGLLPMLSQLFVNARKVSPIPPGWAIVVLAIAGTLVLLDRLAG